MTAQSVEDLLSARRAELGQGNGDTPAEIIPPADQQTGEIIQPEAAPTASALVPVDGVAPVVADAHFPTIPPKVLGGLPYAANYMKLAKTIHNTELVPKAFKGRPDAIMAAMMYGYELGLGPMQALNGLHVIEGKVGQDAELMRALITEQGHLFVLQSGEDDDGEPWATVHCRRKDWPSDIPSASFTWTLDDGRKAGLVEWYEKWTTTERGGNRKMTWNPHGEDPRPEWLDSGRVELKHASSWANYGEDMCIARATARAARANFADVLKGMSYTPEELAEFDGASRQTEEETPSPTPPTTPPPPTPPLEPSAETETTGGDPPATTEPAPSAPADESPSSSPSSPPAKKTRSKKTAPAKTGETSTAPSPSTGTDPSPSDTGTDPGTPSTETAPSPSDSPPVQPDLAGNTPEPEPPATTGEAAVLAELRSSLRALIQSKPQAEANLIRVFLGRHFPGRNSDQLEEAELTKAINIAAGWPGSADTYPAPDPDPVDDEDYF